MIRQKERWKDDEEAEIEGRGERQLKECTRSERRKITLTSS